MDYRQNILQSASSQISALDNGINTTPNEIVADNGINMHDKMYKYAVECLKTEYSDLFGSNEYIITELGDGSVYDAPFVSVSIYKMEHSSTINEQTYFNTDSKPVKYLFSLEQWWPDAPYSNQNISTSSIIYNKNNKNNKKQSKFKGYSDWTNCECTYIDYVSNTAEVKSKVYNWKRKIPLNVLLYINKDETYIPMSESISKMNSTSSFLYQHKRQMIIRGAE